jgi:Protein of unknown function (DUF2637)
MPTTSPATWPTAEQSGRPTMRATPQPHRPPSITDPSVQAADVWLRRFQAAVVTIMAAVAVAVGAVAFFTSFEAIRSYAKTSGGITPAHAWAIPLLVDSFIVIATGAELWLGVHPAKRAWWELAWPRALLAGAAMVSFVLNVAHAKAGDWPARGVAAIPPAALVLSVELLVLIARRAALARTHRLTTATQANNGEPTTTEVVWGDQATTMVATSSDRPALEATTSGDHPTIPAGGHAADATSSTGDQLEATSGAGDRPPTTSAAKATSAGQASGGATYQRVRELYLGGVTVAAEIARELGVSASYAQRTLRRVKRDLVPQQSAAGAPRATTPERTDQATSDRQPDAARSPDHPTIPEHDREATSRDQATTPGHGPEATKDGDGRTTTASDRHLVLVALDRHQDRDRGEVER